MRTIIIWWAFLLTINCVSAQTNKNTPHSPLAPATTSTAAPTVTTVQPTCGTPTGTITITDPVGSNYSYNVNGNWYVNNIIVLPANTYIIYAKNTSDGTITNSIVETIFPLPSPPAKPTATPTSPTTCGALGTITVTSPTGANIKYSIDGTNYQSSPNFTNVASGSYHVTATDGNSCPSPAFDVTITAPPGAPATPIIDNATIHQPTCSTATGQFTISNYNVAYTYNITPSTGVTVSGSTYTVPAGTTYAVSATSGTCTSSATNVTINSQPIVPVISNKTITVCSGESFSITPANGTDVVPTGTTYSWSDPTGSGFTGGTAGSGATTISGTLTNTTRSLMTATYTVTPTAGSCTGNTFNVTVTIKPVPTISDKTASICSGNGFTIPVNGADIMPDGLTYSWSAPTGSGFTGGTSGSGAIAVSGTLSNTTTSTATAVYTVTPTAGGCSGSNFSFTVNIHPKSTIIGNTTICQGTTTSLTGSIAASTTSVPWGSYNTDIADVDNTGLVTAFSKGQAHLYYNDANNCNTSFIVNVNPTPSISVTVPPTCSADLLTYSVGVSVSDGTLTSTKGVVTNTSGASWTITSIPAGTAITLTANNVSSCSSSLSISAPDCSCTVVNAPVSDGNKQYCIGSAIPSLTATVGTGETIDWYATATGGTALATGTNSYTPASAGIYYAEARNATSNCKSTTRTAITLTANALPTVSGTQTVCVGSTTTLVGTGTAATTNPWTSATPTVATVNNAGVVTGVSAGQSTITYTNSNGCTATVKVTVSASSSISGSFKACVGSSTTLTGSAIPDAVTPWLSATPTTATVNNTGLVTGISAGNSNITYKNSNGCTTSITFVVNALPSISGTLNVCVGSTTTLTGAGTAASKNAWTSSAPAIAIVNNAGVVTGVSVGQSIITYTNSNGCTATTTVTVDVLPDTPVSSITQPTCALATGTIAVTSPVGLNYSIDGSDYSNTSGIFSGLAVGTYQVTAKNTSGCISASKSETIIESIPPIPAVNKVQPTCTVSTGTITIAAPTGTIYSYSTDGTNYQSSTSFSNVASGTYTVSVKNTNSGCLSTIPNITIDPQPPTLNAPNINLTQPNCLIATGTITVTDPIVAGTSFSIDGTTYTNTTGVFTNLGVASYPVTAKNSNGCISASTQGIILSPVFTLPKSDFTLSTYTINNKYNSVYGSITPEPGTNYIWDLGDGTNSTGAVFPPHYYNIIGNEAKITVTLSATDLIGCKSATSKSIIVTPFVPNVFTPNGDGHNDYFMPNYEMDIYDRYGILLYSGTKESKGWDGSYKGQKADPDTYFYIIHYTDYNNQKQTIKGYITLIR